MTHDSQRTLQNRGFRHHFSMQDFLYNHSSTEHARLNPAYVGLHAKRPGPQHCMNQQETHWNLIHAALEPKDLQPSISICETPPSKGREHTWSIRRGCVRLFGCGACLDVPMFGSAIPVGSLVVITL